MRSLIKVILVLLLGPVFSLPFSSADERIAGTIPENRAPYSAPDAPCPEGTTARRIAAADLAPSLDPHKDLHYKKQVPNRPSQNKNLSREIPEITFGCKREFTVDGETIPIDSYNKRDGERLRPYLQHDAGAIAELDTYQNNRVKALKSAYIGSFGIFVAIVGPFLADALSQKNGDGTDPATLGTVKNILRIGGFGMAVGSLFYSLAVLRTNESHISQAVKIANDKKPERVIELQFSTGFAF